MRDNVKDFVEKCDICQKFKQPHELPVAPLRPIMSSKPWQIVALDVAGPLTTTDNGNRFIIVAIDHFSKWMEVIATPDFTAYTTAQFLFNQVICRFGIPDMIISDQGVNFESGLFKYLCQYLKVGK